MCDFELVRFGSSRIEFRHRTGIVRFHLSTRSCSPKVVPVSGVHPRQQLHSRRYHLTETECEFHRRASPESLRTASVAEPSRRTN